MTGGTPLVRDILHGAALAISAWALIATSAPDEPARDCFIGLDSGDTYLRVVLSAGAADAGSADASDDAAPPDASESGAGVATWGTAPSCRGMDGLSAGSVLDFHLQQGPRPTTGGCYGYETLDLTPITDVTLNAPSSPTAGSALASAVGTFSSTSALGCRGQWNLSLAPENLPPPGQTVSPIDLDAGSRWKVVRRIDVAQAQFCNGVFAQRGAVTCADTFPVQSASEHSGP